MTVLGRELAMSSRQLTFSSSELIPLEWNRPLQSSFVYTIKVRAALAISVEYLKSQNLDANFSIARPSATFLKGDFTTS